MAGIVPWGDDSGLSYVCGLVSRCVPCTTSAIEELMHYQSQRAEWNKNSHNLAECPALALNSVEIGVVCCFKCDAPFDKCKYQEKYLMLKQVSNISPGLPPPLQISERSAAFELAYLCEL